MKKLIAIFVFIFIGFTAYAETSSDYYHRVGGYFYTNLTPYGTWIEIDYGVVAWRPTIIKRNWAPYKIGRWIWTDYGWYWDSYEPFGHIVFHYGRWYYDDYYGWIWIPDDEWAPAWVEWRYDDDYIGWAPLHPYAVFSVNFGIRITYNYYVPYTQWHFVTYKHFCNPYVYNYYVPSKYKYRIYDRTKERYEYKYYNGRVRNEGIDFDLVRKRSGQKIEKRDLITSNDPREFENIKRRDEDRIRTFIADRNEIQRDRESLREVKIERSERRPKLELEKVELAEVKRTRTNDRNEVNDRKQTEQERSINRDDKFKDRTDSNERERNQNLRNREEQRRTIEQEKSRKNDSRELERRKEVELNSRIDRDSEFRNDNRRFEMKKNESRVNEQRNEVRRNEQIENRNFEQKRTETRTIESKRTDNERKVETNRNLNQQRNNNSDRRQNTSRTERTR
ncbi:Hypothetical protein IALB_1799 [Ignavibacterium album JCM 16511]|uniref:Uncharacterized protein n=1 Tax=Ignavibacterium album (strain DSM 19864 / JCM 16511 / NBRC 101810 / Mat9-16) TaxID=945713 RepID=I0AKJ9_IGNAJ|nr:DUF6600 domain-containing protein [Ignavibacterium album]AFH49506.1 Hypothetical protein IALB_1799 [Ignavibacterium album JCM 16511]